MAANDRQVGGEHYKVEGHERQHWDVVAERGWCYLVGCATKYLWRLGKKGKTVHEQLQDLEKAIHFLEKKREQLLAAHLRDCGVFEEAGPGYVDQDR